MERKLLVEIGFSPLAYSQVVRFQQAAADVFREYLAGPDLSCAKMEIFFSTRRVTLWTGCHNGAEGEEQVAPRVGLALKEALSELAQRQQNTWNQVEYLAAIYGATLVDVAVAGVKGGRKVLAGTRTILVQDCQHYWREMNRAQVLVDNVQRERRVRKLLAQAAKESGGYVVNSDLLDKVVVACEQPRVAAQQFDRRFLSLPEPLLLAVLAKARMFAVEDGDGQLLNWAVGVYDFGQRLENPGPLLAEAAQDYHHDLAVPEGERLAQLAKMPYLEGLGNWLDKQNRLQKIVLTIADQVEVGERVVEVARRAVGYCKIDLTTRTCANYPRLHGTMGAMIARRAGEDEKVATAVGEHLLPGEFSQRLPCTLVGALLGVADRLDDICGHYHQGQLRLSQYRLVKAWMDQVIAILDSVGLSISIRRMLKFALALYESQELVPWREKDLDYLMKIFADRLYCYLLDREFAPGIARALTAVGPENVYVTMEKAAVLSARENREDRETCVQVCRTLDRVCPRDLDHEEAAREFLEVQEEKDLFDVYLTTKDEVERDLAELRFARALARLAKLSGAVERFVANVDIDIPDLPVKLNRLSLLAEIRSLYHQFADFGII